MRGVVLAQRRAVLFVTCQLMAQDCDNMESEHTLYNTKGIGINRIDRNPSRLLAQSTPSLLNMAVAKS